MQRERRGSSVGTDEAISGAKIAPLDSEMKRNTPHADSHGVIGEDEVLESTHIPPFPEHHHPQAQSHWQQQHGNDNMGGMHHQRHHQAVEKGREKMQAKQQKEKQQPMEKNM